MAYKMIALDLDGTLNNDEKVITPRTREALMAVQEQGVIVALVSGRQAPGLQREADALHLEDYHGLRISYNGGRIEDATTGQILFDPQGIRSSHIHGNKLNFGLAAMQAEKERL